MKTYTIKSGDTLSKIAHTFRTTVKAIQNANSNLIKDVNKISVGWVLKIPVSEGSEKNYEQIGKALESCLKDIENLDSFKRLSQLI